MGEGVVGIVDVHALVVVVAVVAALARASVLRPDVGLGEAKLGHVDAEQLGEGGQQARVQRQRVRGLAGRGELQPAAAAEVGHSLGLRAAGRRKDGERVLAGALHQGPRQ
jgi:hypothetical protein